MTLTPNFEGNQIATLGVRLTLENPQVSANQSLVTMNNAVATTPTQFYSSDAIDASDASGRLSLAQVDNGEHGDEGLRKYIVTRPTNGDVVLKFTAKPASMDLGPRFEFRTQPDGLGATVAGYNFLPLPEGNIFTINVDWDLAEAPAGTRGVWSFGENSATKVGTPDLLASTFYAFGQMKSFPEAGTQSNYSMYWFGEPPFNITQAAVWTGQLFGNMQRYFRDGEDTYRVFARHAGGSGGSALLRSFLFTYDNATTNRDLEGLLAHEMVHNWPTMTGTGADTTWYVEGIAEYYSARLPFRFGMQTTDRFLEVMNSLAKGYYGNRYINITNEEQAGLQFSDTAKQALPYGRGLMFLVKLDAEIRAKSNGTHSLDNIVQALLDRTRAGTGDTIQDLLQLMVQERGPEAQEEYQDMANGKLVIPQENSLGPCFSVVKTTTPVVSGHKTSTLEQNKQGLIAVSPTNPSAIAVAYQWVKRPGLDDSKCVI
ncbi:hypothetical protein BKA64DRAFT_571934 [Cadophora sp. MPI-SDFR-AT-0126]|nr:hypothetical protein BKA64DRAFT_571934 [Leotiomycetes sp. MPI-SDFR-AT-0126]